MSFTALIRVIKDVLDKGDLLDDKGDVLDKGCT